MNEVWEEIKHVDTSRASLRSFGLMVGGVFVGIAVVLWWYGGYVAGTAVRWLGGAGALLVVLGGTLPVVLRPVYRVWMALALTLGFFMTRLLLSIVFYGLVTPIGLLRRLVAQDPLDRDLDETASTYWKSKKYSDLSPERLEKYY